jgi:hypothetical protein
VSDLELRLLGFLDLLPAFANGALDGANMIGPILCTAVNRGGFTVVADTLPG